MPLVYTPSFTDLYPTDKKPSFEKLISGLPQVLVLQFLARINLLLYLDQHNQRNQLRILHELLHRNEEDYYKAIKWVHEMNTYGKKTQYFNSLSSIDFIHKILILGNENTETNHVTSEDELNIFKALILINEEISEQAEVSIGENDLQVLLQRFSWTLLPHQSLLSKPIHYLTAVIKSKCFFDSIIESKYKSSVQVFLNKIEEPNTLNYLLKFISILQESTNIDSGKKPTNYLIPDESNSFLLSQLSLDTKEYKKYYKKNHKGYLGLKDKPLMKIQNLYCVLDWNLFSGKIYYGLIYDFYKRSNLDNEIKFHDFKNFIGENSIEKYLFRRLIKSIYRGKNVKLFFDDKNKKGYPDCYIRDGNQIFILELKDSSFNSEILNSNNYEKIKNEIDNKLNRHDKGTGQLVKHCSAIEQGEIEEACNVKNRNLVVYPIIVFTDPVFELPGVMRYLQGELKLKLDAEQVGQSLKKINPLIALNIDFFIEHIHLLKRKEYSLHRIFNEVYKETLKREKLFERSLTQSNHFNLNASFKELTSSLFEGKNIDHNYVKTVFKELELDKNL